MLRRVWGVSLLRAVALYFDRGAYQRFLTALAESQAGWTMHKENGVIRSVLGDCPTIAVYKQLFRRQADAENSADVFWAGFCLGLSYWRTCLIMGAADSRTGSDEHLCVRNDLLIALAEAKKRMDASREGMLVAECRWESHGKKLVGV